MEHQSDQAHIPVETGDESCQSGGIVAITVLGNQKELVAENAGGKAANGDQGRDRQQVGRLPDNPHALLKVPGRIVCGGRQTHFGKPRSRPLEQQLDQHCAAHQNQHYHQEQTVRSKVAVAHHVGGEEADADPAQDGSQLDQGENPARFPRGQGVVGQRPAHHGAHSAERVHPGVNQQVHRAVVEAGQPPEEGERGSEKQQRADHQHFQPQPVRKADVNRNEPADHYGRADHGVGQVPGKDLQKQRVPDGLTHDVGADDQKQVEE